MKERKELLIIIPAYNEEKNLPQLLEKLENAGDGRNSGYSGYE